MFSVENSDFKSVNSSLLSANSDTSVDLTQPGQIEPIRILLFPPKNKQFRFHEEANRIEIEPLPPDDLEQETCLNKITLTSPVNCDFFNSTLTLETPPIENSKTEKNEALKVKEVLQIKKVFQNSKLRDKCFLKGCKWSCDGLCLLSNSEDCVLRLFEISDNFSCKPQQDIEPVLQFKEGGIVYDFAWYSKMNSCDPISCVFITTSQNSPIHLWDAYTGELRATYQPINQYDEVTSAYSLAFTPDGSKIYAGFKKCLRIFDIGLPGRISEERNLKIKGKPFQSSIISSICVNPMIPSLYALGSYDKTIGIYTEPEGELLCILKGHCGGITQTTFSSDGVYLFSGARKDDEILCWDLRNPGKVVFSVERRVDTQQKILFDLSPDQKYLITGTTDGNIKIFNIKNQNEKILKPENYFKGHEDCVNGVQFHPSLPIFASSSGQRHLPEPFDEEDNNDTNDKGCTHNDNSIKIWSYSEQFLDS